jgi:hypothetical protein
VRALAFVSLIAFFSTCASVTPFVITGESINSAGKDFVICADLMDHALDSKLVTPEQYNEWKAFGIKFKLSYPIAVQLWESARNSNDVVLEQRALAILVTLAAELAKFYEPVKELILSIRDDLKDGGTP